MKRRKDLFIVPWIDGKEYIYHDEWYQEEFIGKKYSFGEFELNILKKFVPTKKLLCIQMKFDSDFVVCIDTNVYTFEPFWDKKRKYLSLSISYNRSPFGLYMLEIENIKEIYYTDYL